MAIRGWSGMLWRGEMGEVGRWRCGMGEEVGWLEWEWDIAERWVGWSGSGMGTVKGDCIAGLHLGEFASRDYIQGIASRDYI
jgi:hypothetical protein